MRATARHAYAGVTFILLALVSLHGIFGYPASTMVVPSAGVLPPEWEAAAKALAPSELRLRPSSHGPCRLEGIDASGVVRWHAVFSAFMTPRPAGYSGSVDLVAGFDDTGSITGVRILRQNETPTFAAGIDSDWFLGQFVGKSPDSPLVPGQDIDGLTHATVTVEAVCEALRRGFAAARAQAPDETSPAVIPPPVSAQTTAREGIVHTLRKRPDSGNLPAIIIAISAALLQRYTGPAFAACIVVLSLGFLSQQFVSLSHARFLLGGSVSAQAALVFAAAALAIVIARRGYCRFLCPCGRTQDLMHALSNAASSAPHTPSGARTIRGAGRAILWSSLILLPLAGGLPLERAEVFSALFLRNLGPWGLVLVISILAGSFLTPRFYCRTLCPLNPLFEDIETFRTIISRTISSSKSGSGGTS